MIPTTVGEIRQVIKDLPDNMLFDLDVKCGGPLLDATLEVKPRYVGYDGTKSEPKYDNMLVLTVTVDD